MTEAGMEAGGPTSQSSGSRSGARPPSLPQLVLELRDLVIAYFKQEVGAPLKSLLRYVAFGVGGAILLGFGALFLGVGALRALQTETNGTFSGDWSWAPYLIVVMVLFASAGLVWVARGARADRTNPDRTKQEKS